jgi:hypothetical protein
MIHSVRTLLGLGKQGSNKIGDFVDLKVNESCRLVRNSFQLQTSCIEEVKDIHE